jgi:hypothetical protein
MDHLPRFLPSQRLTGSLEPRILGASHGNRALRPQGFAPSRRFAPQRTFRAYFIPVPLSGFRPPRCSSRTSAERFLKRPSPQGLSRPRSHVDAVPSGYCRWPSLAHNVGLFTLRRCESLPGLSLLRGFLLRPATIRAECQFPNPRSTNASSPHALSFGNLPNHGERQACCLAARLSSRRWDTRPATISFHPHRRRRGGSSHGVAGLPESYQQR